MNPPLRLAYLISQYPAIPHSYILSEILLLRQLGLELHTVSVSPADRPPDLLAPDEHREWSRTFYIKSAGALYLLQAHLATLAARPVAYLRGLAYALSLGRGNPRKSAYSLFYFLEAVTLGRWMLSRKLSHVHIHYASAVGLVAVRIFPISMSISIHGSAEFLDPRGFHLAEKIRASAFIRAISLYGKGELMQSVEHTEWNKIELSRLGIDPALFPPRPFREHPSPFEIVCVGRLSPEKGQYILLEVFERLVRQGRPVRLRLAGDGPDRTGLEREAASRGLSEHIVFEGWCSQAQLRQIYSQADLCALTSFREGIPLSLMEAMAMEIPCLASRVTGLPELIRDGEDGILCAPADQDGMVEAIGRLMDDPALRRRLGEAARRRILETYHFPCNIRQLAGIFERRLRPLA